MTSINLRLPGFLIFYFRVFLEVRKQYNFFHLLRREMKKWKKSPSAPIYLQSADANETNGKNRVPKPSSKRTNPNNFLDSALLI